MESVLPGGIGGTLGGGGLGGTLGGLDIPSLGAPAPDAPSRQAEPTAPTLPMSPF